MGSTRPSTSRVLERLERVRYFAGLVLGVDDFRTEQDYFRKKLRRHNLLLHGWGIVYGLGVTTDSQPWTVFVEPGYAIDQWGEEIVLDVAQTADVRPHCQGLDHCALYVVIRYRATPTRLVPAPGTPVHEAEGAMQYSRWMDGYELALVEQCPTWEEGPSGASLTGDENSPWMILGQITADANGKVTVQHCAERRRLRLD